MMVLHLMVLSSITFRAAGTNTATVGRVFINNGQTNATASNNILYNEITLTATTLSEVASTANYVLPMNIALPPENANDLSITTTESSNNLPKPVVIVAYVA